LTLADALAFALRRSPHLEAQSMALRSREAERRQAGLRANPEVGVEVENIGGRGEARGFDAAETTVQLSQSLDPAGKRGKRKQLAARAVDVAAWELEIARLDLVAEVTRRFVEVLATQERVALLAELTRLHESTLNTVAERVAAGKSAPTEEARARIDLANAKVRQEGARRELTAARHRLAAAWGGSAPSFASAVGDFYTAAPPPAELDTSALAARNPDVAWQALAAELRQAATDLERANRLPELTLSGGVRHFNDTGDVSYVMGLSVPLPLFDRNQGAVRAAEFDLAATEAIRRATEASVHASLVEALQILAAAHHAVRELAETILPDSERMFAATLEGYHTGKHAYLTVLDAQRTLFEARAEYIDALEDYHKAQAELERLIGTDIDSPKHAEAREDLESPEHDAESPLPEGGNKR
jgi:cobalt-zinc-cadmium efflux system outer membrane protein